MTKEPLSRLGARQSQAFKWFRPGRVGRRFVVISDTLMATNYSSLPEDDFVGIAREVDRHDGLNEVLAWAADKPKNEIHPRIVAEVITQDEYTRDVIIPYRNIFLVYDTT